MLLLSAVVFVAFAGVFVFGVAGATASLGPPILEDSQEWYTISNTVVYSVFVDDVDGDGVKEIITAGYAFDGTRNNGQLRVWNWDGITLEGSQEWYTVGTTCVYSVFVDDVDGDGVKEIITAGYAYIGTLYCGQLRVWNWNGTTMALERSHEWFTLSNTYVYSVFVDDVDEDGVREIITGGRAYDGTWDNGQLRVWNWDGTTLTLEKSQEWFLTTGACVESVLVDDVDRDGVKEIVSGGYAAVLGRLNGQLRVWNWDGTTLTLETSQEWYTIGSTLAKSVFVDDVDGDGVNEILTGGYAYDGVTRFNGQLRVWNWDGSTMTLEGSREWYTINNAYVESVFADDVDGDGVKEIVSGGYASDLTRVNGQLRVWNWDGSTMTLEGSREWYTISHTYVESVFVDDVDSDSVKEIVTGGYLSDGTRYGQLRLWAPAVVDSLNVNIDAGSTHFRGEIAEFYVLTSYRGTPINPTQIILTLYRPDGTQTSLTAQQVAKGLYKIPYTIPSNAPTGTYTLTVEASYQTNAKDLKGANLKSFQLSSTLTQWNAWLQTIQQDTTTIKADIATVKTDIGLIKLNLTAINANITAIKGNVATITTDIGTIKADVTTIKAKVTSIDGNIATIETDVGTIKADISTIDTESIPSIADTQTSQGTTLNIATALAALAAIGALGTLALIFTKRKQT